MTTPPTPSASTPANALNAQLTALLGDSTAASTYFGANDPAGKIYTNGATSLASLLGITPTADQSGAWVSPRQIIDALAALGRQTGTSGTSASVVVSIQNLLKQAGAYSGSTSIKSDGTQSGFQPLTGVIQKEDLTALGTYLNGVQSFQAGQAQLATRVGATPRYTDPLAALQQDALVGQQQGVIAGLNNRLDLIQKQRDALAGQTISVTHADPNALAKTVKDAALSVLGHSLNKDEQDALVAHLDEQITGKNTALAKATALANQLDTDYAATLEGNQTVTDTVQAATTGQVKPDLGGFDISAMPAGRTDPSLQPVNLDKFMDAYAKEGNFGALNNPAMWQQYAQASGLGANAAQSQANIIYVGRYMANYLEQKYGSWDAAVVGLDKGVLAAQQYASNPDAAKWTKPDASGTSVSTTIAAVNRTLTPQPGDTPTPSTTSFGLPTPGTFDSSAATGSSMPQVVETTQADPAADTEAALRAAHPDEAKAHDAASRFGSFLDLLTGAAVGGGGNGVTA